MALDHMSILSDGLYPTAPADTTERYEHVSSRGLFIDFPGYVVVESVFNTIFNIGRAGITFMKGIFKIG